MIQSDSPSYPGLRSEYEKSIYTVRLDTFQEDWYIEEQSGEDWKTTYFIWEQIAEKQEKILWIDHPISDVSCS